MSWNIDALRAFAKATGIPSANDVINSLSSVDDIFKYHALTARDALRGIIDDAEPTGHENVTLAFGIADDLPTYCKSKLASHANTIAALMAVRNMGDIFAFLVNKVVLKGALTERRCDIRSVAKALAPSAFRTQIEEMIASASFQYVSDFCNVTKHRRLAPHSFYVSFENGMAGMRIGEFEYDGTPYPHRWIREVLEDAVEVKNRIVALGNTLNIECGL